MQIYFTKPKKALFVSHYIKHRNAAQAVRDMGCYHPNCAKEYGCLMMRDYEVQEMLNKAEMEMMAKAGYDVDRAMKEAEDAILLANMTGNASAYVKAVELRAKLSGLLDRALAGGGPGGGFVIQINGVRESVQIQASPQGSPIGAQVSLPVIDVRRNVEREVVEEPDPFS